MWRVDFGLITACLTRCRYYRCACIWLSNPTFWQRNLSSLKWDQITQSAGNCWTKIKLRSAANHAIYLVIFHWVVGSLYLNWYINFTTVGFLVCTEERSVSLYACKFDCFNWTKWGTFPMLSPWSSCKVGDPSSYVPRPPPPRPPAIDASADRHHRPILPISGVYRLWSATSMSTGALCRTSCPCRPDGNAKQNRAL